MALDEDIAEIRSRNERVEADKAWETSVTRRICVAVITYILACIFFWLTGTPKFYLSAVVPTCGFVLSTLSLQQVKHWWLKRHGLWRK